MSLRANRHFIDFPEQRHRQRGSHPGRGLHHPRHGVRQEETRQEDGEREDQEEAARLGTRPHEARYVNVKVVNIKFDCRR